MFLFVFAVAVMGHRTKELFNSLEILKIHRLNILNTAIFMYIIYTETTLAISFEVFLERLSYVKCAIRYLKLILLYNLTICKYKISRRGVLIGNN